MLLLPPLPLPLILLLWLMTASFSCLGQERGKAGRQPRQGRRPSFSLLPASLETSRAAASPLFNSSSPDPLAPGKPRLSSLAGAQLHRFSVTPCVTLDKFLHLSGSLANQKNYPLHPSLFQKLKWERKVSLPLGLEHPGPP